MFFALFRLSISEAQPLSISVALGLSIYFIGTSSTFSRKIDYVTNQNLNRITGSRVMAILLNGWILPIGRASPVE